MIVAGGADASLLLLLLTHGTISLLKLSIGPSDLGPADATARRTRWQRDSVEPVLRTR